ncbi:hypothetical protein BV22DRAFT_1039204 [Leucogyrophana mollusca]|uniref:Uncharacterized protein n=1 Tax=Leucogyrophana mollusca TaxID=85980 RepID=A0ACB8B6A6_9AGAM|nr:hypothetical protein BV22DRAFT_1039204 [Leucogyrophana mollusca]
MALVEANRRYEEHLSSTRKPGEWTLPFGKYKGQRLDQIPDDYRWCMVNIKYASNSWHSCLVGANRRYQASLNPDRSPGSEIIWFGKRYRGYRFDAVYQRPGFMRFCFSPGREITSWYPRLVDLYDRYEAWLQNHRREYRPRRPAVIENPVGEAIGPWDDGEGSAASDEEYERDSWLASDDESIEMESDGSENMGDDGMDDGDDIDYKPTKEEIGAEEDENTGEEPPDSDDDKPLTELARARKTSRRSRKAAERTEEQTPRRRRRREVTPDQPCEESDVSRPLTRSAARAARRGVAKDAGRVEQQSPTANKRYRNARRIDSDSDESEVEIVTGKTRKRQRGTKE